MLLGVMLPERTKPKPEIVQLEPLETRQEGGRKPLCAQHGPHVPRELCRGGYVEDRTDPTRRPPTCAGVRSTNCLTR